MLHRSFMNSGLAAVLLLTFVASLLVSPPSTSAEKVAPQALADWQSTGLNYGVFDLAAHPTDASTWFAATSQGLMVTNDGSNWRSLLSGFMMSVAIIPGSPGQILASKTSLSRVYRSSDGGVTWASASIFHPIDEGANIFDIAVSPIDSATIYAGLEAYGVYRSLDGGVTWTEANNGLDRQSIFQIIVDQRNPNTIYAAGFNGVFISNDGGNNWEAGVGLPDAAITRLAQDPQNSSVLYAVASGSGLYHSTDGGSTWAQTSLKLSDQVHAVAVSLAAPYHVFVGTDDGVYASTDGGQTWSVDGLAGVHISRLLVTGGSRPVLLASPGMDVGLYQRGLITNSSGSVTLTGLPADGEALHIECANWSACRDSAVDAFAYDSLSLGTVQASFENGAYYIKRLFFFFDTSALPANARIVNASFAGYVANLNSGNTAVHIVPASADIPLSGDDFSRVQLVSGGSATPQGVGWMEIPLNATGLGAITPGGETRLALAHNFDVANIAPSSNNDLLLLMAEAGQYQPKLTITYTVAERPCARFEGSGTYLDGTLVTPGQSFQKRWRLGNCGESAIGAGYEAVRVAGTYGPASFPVSIAAGASAEVAASFTAPVVPGTYRATYRMQGPGGLFGDSFWVEIRVRSAPPSTYIVSGSVRQGTTPLADVKITAVGPDRAFAQTYSDARGTFTLTGLVAGTYQIAASATDQIFGTAKQITIPTNNSLLFEGTPVQPAKREIAILVHGWQGLNFTNPNKHRCEPTQLKQRDIVDLATANNEFAAVGAQLVEGGYEVYLANWTTGPGYTMTAQEAAKQCLGPQIESIAGRDIDGRVLLVAHSMGGIVSRAYIEGKTYPGNVEVLVTLGTPHVGVNANALIKLMMLLSPKSQPALALICRQDPGLCQLGSDQMLLFNSVYRPRPSVPYLFIGGSGGPFMMGGFLSATEGRNDGIVGFRSGTGYLYTKISDLPLVGRPLLDDILIVSGGDITRRYNSAAHFEGFEGGSRVWHFKDSYTRDCVKEFVAAIERNDPLYRAACPAMFKPALDLAQEATAPVAFTPTLSGTLRAGDILTTTLQLDGSPTDVLLGWGSGGLSMTLTVPGGILIDAANVVQLLPGSSYHGPESASAPRVSSYQLSAPPAGAWVATIAATDVVTKTEFTLFAALQSPLKLALNRPSSVAAGQPFVLSTTISAGTTPVDSATVVASMATGSGVQAVMLRQTGPGIYSGQLSAPPVAGPYLLTVTAAGTGGQPFSRQVDDLIMVRSSGVQRQGSAVVTPIDRNRNGRYESIEVSITYTAAVAGDYTALGTLQDANGRAITLTRSQASWSAGNNTISFAFDGGEILAAGVNGPYQMAAQIIAGEDAQLVVDEQPLISNLSYQASSFEAETKLPQIFLPLLLR